MPAHYQQSRGGGGKHNSSGSNIFHKGCSSSYNMRSYDKVKNSKGESSRDGLSVPPPSKGGFSVKGALSKQGGNSSRSGGSIYFPKKKDERSTSTKGGGDEVSNRGGSTQGGSVSSGFSDKRESNSSRSGSNCTGLSTKNGFSLGYGTGGAGGRLMIRPKGTLDILARKKEILSNRAKGRGREREGTTKAPEEPIDIVLDIDVLKVEDIATRVQAPEVCQIKLEDFHLKKRQIYLKDIERRIDRLDDIEKYPEWVTTVYKELELNGCATLIPGSDEEVNETHDSYVRSIILNSVTIENFFFNPKSNTRDMLLALKEEFSKVESIDFLTKKLKSLSLSAVTPFKYNEKDAEKFIKQFVAFTARIFATSSASGEKIPSNLAQIFLDTACKVKPYKNFLEKGQTIVDKFKGVVDEFKLTTITDSFLEFVKLNTANNPGAGFNQKETFKKFNAAASSCGENEPKKRKMSDSEHRGHGPPVEKAGNSTTFNQQNHSAYSLRRVSLPPQKPEHSPKPSHSKPALRLAPFPSITSSKIPNEKNNNDQSPLHRLRYIRNPPTGPSMPIRGPPSNPTLNGPPTAPQSKRNGPSSSPEKSANQRGPPLGPSLQKSGLINIAKDSGPKSQPLAVPSCTPKVPAQYLARARAPSFQQSLSSDKSFQRSGPPSGPPSLGPNTQFPRNAPLFNDSNDPRFYMSGPSTQQGLPPLQQQPFQAQYQGKGQPQPQQLQEQEIPVHPIKHLQQPNRLRPHINPVTSVSDQYAISKSQQSFNQTSTPQISYLQNQGYPPYQQFSGFNKVPMSGFKRSFNPMPPQQSDQPSSGFIPYKKQQPGGPSQQQPRLSVANKRCPSCHELGHGIDQCWKTGY